MNELPAAGRRFVTAVITVGVVLLAVCLPLARFEQPAVFLALLVLSSASAALKVYLPLTLMPAPQGRRRARADA